MFGPQEMYTKYTKLAPLQAATTINLLMDLCSSINNAIYNKISVTEDIHFSYLHSGTADNIFADFYMLQLVLFLLGLFQH